MPEYRVNLDIYDGPLDLLLYLIRRDEVDIYDIPIARITEQYVRYVELLKRLDPNLAGTFLVMAATLMEIKTRMLLPTPSPEEGGEEGLEIDPRAELVRQLLEYKAFKDAAGNLREAAAAQALKFSRRLAHADDDEAELDLEDAQVWDLLDAFSRLMAAVGADAATHEVIYDDTPIELHEADILDRLHRDGAMSFRRIFEGRRDRGEILGLFLALLELIRVRRVLATQRRNFSEILVRLNPKAPEEALHGRPDGEAFSGRRHGGPASEHGEYVSDTPRPQGEEDDAGRETSEAES
jgi:segregation and condensation protein A